MIHLSARLAWHNSGWNGCVCKFPHLNSSCIGNETIRDERDDEKERQFAGTQINQLECWDRKRKWYEEKMGIPVIGDGAMDVNLEPGQFPIVITSRDKDDGGIDVPRIEGLIRKYILLED